MRIHYPRQDPSDSTPPVDLPTSVDIPGASSTEDGVAPTSGANTPTETLSTTDTVSSPTGAATNSQSLSATSLETATSSIVETTSIVTTITPTTSLSSSTQDTTSLLTTTPTTPTTAASSSSEFTATDSFTTVTTSINGQLTTFTSPIPTTLIESSQQRGENSARTGLIAGLTTGFLVFLFFFLGAIFAFRRHRRKKVAEAEITAEKKRKENRSLLDSEGFDDDVDERYSLAMREYGAHPAHVTGTSPNLGQVRSGSPTLSILRTRAASDTGSIFREDVWPPPVDELVDPIVMTSSQIDLSQVIEDVMGPTHSRNNTESTMASSNSLFIANNSYPSRDPSLQSQYMDYGSQGSQSALNLRPSSTSFPSSYPSFTSAAGFASSSSLPPPSLPPLVPPPVLAANITSSPIALYRPNSPNALRSTSPESSISSASGTPLESGGFSPSSRAPPSPTSPTNPHRLSSSVPKKSSPLARRLSQDAKTWLTGTPAWTGHKKAGTS